jgi:hypothetical protein
VTTDERDGRDVRQLYLSDGAGDERIRLTTTSAMFFHGSAVVGEPLEVVPWVRAHEMKAGRVTWNFRGQRRRAGRAAVVRESIDRPVALDGLASVTAVPSAEAGTTAYLEPPYFARAHFLLADRLSSN